MEVSSTLAMELQSPSFTILSSFLLFILMVLKIGKRLKTQNSSAALPLPPGPRKLPVIGNMHVLGRSLPHHRLRELAMKYGPLMHLQLGEVTHIIISSPEAAKEVLKTHDIIFAQRPKLLSATVITYNNTDIAFSPYGDYWRQLRKICTMELLTANRVRSFQQIREEMVLDLIQSISSEAKPLVNLSKMISSLTYSITSRVAFGMECEGQEAFISTVERILDIGGGFTVADLFPSIKLLQLISGMRSELKRLHQGADRVLQNIIDKHITRKAAKRAGDDETEDIVDVLLNLREHGNLEFPLTIDNIKAVILDLFIAGSETAATTVEWAMSELLKNPSAMKKAQAEVRQLFDSQGTVSESGIHQLEYLKLVINETLRLHPPVALLLPRECRERCEINGYEIPAKSRVIINAWAIGRDPGHWTEPEIFSPERFLNSSVDYKGAHFEFIPFGGGRRVCPGISFGIANVELLLAQLLYHFDWKLPSGMNYEDLDMTENFGSTVRRKRDLCLVPIPYHPLPVE